MTSSSGTGTLGNTVQFSIPQFGDFFNDMVVHAVIKQPTVTYGAGVESTSDQSLMRWCAYPGERLLKKVKFEVNGNPLDEYTSDAVNFHREFLVQPNKEVGWNRCVGQEESESGSLDQPNWADNGYSASEVNSRICVHSKSGLQTPTGPKTEDVELFIPLLFWCNKDPRLSVPSVAIPYGQRFINIELAEQTEMVGLVGRGVNANNPYGLSGSIAATGGSITPDTAVISKLELYINNIFVNPEVHNIFIKRIGFTLIRVHRRQTHTTNGSSGGTPDSLLLQQLKWPIEALFVGIRMASYNPNGAEQRASTLDRWHKFSSVTDTTRWTRGWKSNKVTSFSNTTPALTLRAGAAISSVVVGAATGTPNLQTTLTFNTAPTMLTIGDTLTWTNVTHGTGTGTVAFISDDGLTVKLRELMGDLNAFDGDDLQTGAHIATSFIHGKLSPAEVTSTVAVCRPTLERVTIKAHGIAIYHDFPAKFYNAYLPYNYGGPNIRTPDDCGALMITFCLYPGTYQPSGHINVSRAREFYIDFTTTNAVTPDATGTLIVIASAINFLLISDGSAVLRYST